MYQRQVPFGEAIQKAFNNYCNFNGRASRSEYWWFVLFTAIISYVCQNIAMFAHSQVLSYVFSGIITLAFLLPSLGICWRRLHDTGRAGGWYFIGLIPIVGWILLIVWFCQPSQPEANRFGDVPNVE